MNIKEVSASGCSQAQVNRPYLLRLEPRGCFDQVFSYSYHVREVSGTAKREILWGHPGETSIQGCVRDRATPMRAAYHDNGADFFTIPPVEKLKISGDSSLIHRDSDFSIIIYFYRCQHPSNSHWLLSSIFKNFLKDNVL